MCTVLEIGYATYLQKVLMFDGNFKTANIPEKISLVKI